MEKNTPWFLHVDLDAFFASVEQLDHPEYKGKPVIVGGKPEDKRSVVSTASYEARKFGVHSAMPTYQAYKLCPQGIYVYGNMKRYAELSYQIMSIFREYSPDVIQMSIDEAFIDITGTEKLFGPPEETAMKIKERVKRDTGLTVSVGLATTKYLAKIGSGFNKPDGFYFIHPGQEQEFMLNLPLSKVWGVGEKGQENLKQKGIRTTRDIYEKSYDSLEFMFGKNTANFLYNVVRGIDVVGFGHESKKHSISAETTFPYDIHDTYTAETQLMDLCHDVMFRLMRENGFSRTAFVKIRYDDFSTVSIQETFDRNIFTVDSYFEIICKLFEKKYEAGRGIRLLGVGFDNIEKEDRPFQQDLFENGNEKKQAVEKAILKLEKKHPEVKIRKARLFNNGTKAVLGLLMWGAALLAPVLTNHAELYAAETKKSEVKGAGTLLPDGLIPPAENPDEETGALFNWNVNDNEVDLELSGFWLMSFNNVLNFSFGNGTGFQYGFGLPVFTQEVDLSTLITLNKTWYFQADFADKFEKNTLAMGYNGTGYIKSARLSNRGITMPSDYSANHFGYALTGGDNQAPGFSMHFADLDNSRWFGDFLVRYDMTKTHSATFYGKNSATDTTINLENFIYGKSFVLPPQAASELASIKDIYVQDAAGTFTDKNGKKYRRLSTTDYIVLRSSSKILFGNAAGTQKKDGKIPTILVTFTEPGAAAAIAAKTGSYSDPQSYAGQIQAFFGSASSPSSTGSAAAAPVNLADYAYNLTTQFEGETALVLQNSVLFSPYLCSSIYDCGITSNADVFVQSKTDGTASASYYAERFETDAAALSNDFIFENHYYAQVANASAGGNDGSSGLPASNWPLADRFPGIYLNTSANTGCELVVRSYSEVSCYEIGTDAVGGTVQVYINNMLDSGATFDAETGIVDLSQPVSDTDKVYIVWQEDASDISGGAVAAAAGLFMNFTPNLSADFAITTRWPVSLFENYATQENPVAGFTAFTAGVSWRPENFVLEDKAALSLNSPNATGNLLAIQHQDSGTQTYYLGNADGFATKNEPVLSGVSGGTGGAGGTGGISSTKYLLQSNNKTAGGHGGITDSSIKGYKIPVAWDFNGLDTANAVGDYNGGTPYWAAADIRLTSGELIKTSSVLELGLQCAVPPDATGNYEVYLQLGISAAEDFSGEDAASIPTWCLTSLSDKKVVAPLNLALPQWQTVIITLSDSDRARLASSSDARLVVLYKPVENASVNSNTGTIYFGPYEPHVQSLFIAENPNFSTNAYTVAALESPGAKTLKMAQCFATKLSWVVSNSTGAAGNSVLTAQRYFDAADISDYKYLNFDFAATSCGPVEIILGAAAGGTGGAGNAENAAVRISISDLNACITPLESVQATPVYHTLCVDLAAKTLSIDGVELDSSLYSVEVNSNVIPDHFTFNLDTCYNGQIVSNGAFYAGNVYFTGCSPYMNVQNYFYAEYKKDGVIAKFGDYEAVKDAVVKLNSNQGLRKIDGAAQAGITLTGIRYEADFNSDLNGGHNIHTDKALFDILSFGESYRFNHTDKSLNKKDNAEVAFTNPFVPFKLSFSTEGKDFNINKTQDSNAAFQIQANTGKVKTGLETKAQVNQKITAGKTNAAPFNTQNYFDGWYDISTLQFSTGDVSASSRKQVYRADLYSELPVLSLRPELVYELQAVYQNLSETTLTDSTVLSYVQPLSFTNHSFNFSYSRTGTGVEQAVAGGTYISDANAIARSYNTRKYVYTAIPFYDLFDKSLPDTVNAAQSSQSALYSSVYSLGWKRKLLNSYLDFIVPSSTSVDFSREIKAGLTQSDLYQLKAVVTNTALNCFGSQSILAWFNWYQQDEFISSLTGTVKIPAAKDEETTFTVSLYNQWLFLISDKASLKTGLDFSLETTLDWNSRATCIFQSPGTTSFVTDIIQKFAEDSDIKILRKEILNLTLGQKDKLLHQQYEFTHSTDFNFLKYYSVTTGIGAVFTSTQNTASNLGITMSIAAKMEF